MIRKSHTSNRSQVRNIRANVCSYHNYNDCRSATMDQKHTFSKSFKENEFIFKNLHERTAALSNKKRNQLSINLIIMLQI